MNDGFERIEEVAFLGDGEIPQKKEDIDGGQGRYRGLVRLRYKDAHHRAVFSNWRSNAGLR